MPHPPIELLAPYQVRVPRADGSEVERLMAVFATHEKRERDSLGAYRESAETHANPLVKFLLHLIVSDEEKHHDIVRRLLASLEADVAWDSQAATMPRLGRVTAEDRSALLGLADSLIAEEKEGIAEYKTLLKSGKGYYNGLLELLVNTVILDSKKHLMILRFLKQKLRKAA